jgi:hypothetical protein
VRHPAGRHNSDRAWTPVRGPGAAPASARCASETSHTQPHHVYRELAAAGPDAFRPDLATSLTNLSLRLGDLGRVKDALAAIEEAAQVHRSWPPGGPMPTITS